MFEEYVIARIQKNVEHRQRRRKDHDAVGDGDWVEVREGAGPKRLADFLTQDLEEELVSRRKKQERRDSGNGEVMREPTPVYMPEIRRRNDFRVRDAASASSVRVQASPHCSEPLQDSWPAPSCGEAARSDGSFVLMTSFVTAKETEECEPLKLHSASYPTPSPETTSTSVSSPLSSPLDGRPAEIEREDCSLPLDIHTQDWREWLESSQAANTDVNVTPQAVRHYVALKPETGSPLAGIPKAHPEIDTPGPSRQLRDELEQSQAGYTQLECKKRCAICNLIADNHCAVLCVDCASSTHKDPDITFCADLFQLCDEQQGVLRLFSCGRNIFYTGAAGTGKSTVLKTIVRYCHRKSLDVEVISPTGIAALSVNGRTIHMYAGWGLRAGRTPIERLEREAKKAKNWKRLIRTEVLVIDEISLVSSFMFTRLDRIMRASRGCDKPFGGVQIVITGDFYQLPPVKAFEFCLTCGSKMKEHKKEMPEWSCTQHETYLDEEKWAFCSPAWEECGFQCVELKQIHRQIDLAFSALLHKIRIGHPLSVEEDAMLLENRTWTDGCGAVRIYPFRGKVSNLNEQALRRLDGERIRFKCVDGYDWNQELHSYLAGRFDRIDPADETSPLFAYSAGEDRHCFDEEFSMKIGMPVVLLANLPHSRSLVNGSRGVIVGFEEYSDQMLPRAKLRSKDTSKHGEWLLPGDHAWYQQQEIRTFISRAPLKRWPIVRFDDGQQCTIYAWCQVQELGCVREEASQERFTLMSRTQIPLVAGWAITTHKSQGMTLERAVVDLSGAWEPGQPYVALSRVRSLQGLKVEDLARGKANRASGKVREFMSMTFRT